jgi:hypothetical protein
MSISFTHHDHFAKSITSVALALVMIQIEIWKNVAMSLVRRKLFPALIKRIDTFASSERRDASTEPGTVPLRIFVSGPCCHGAHSTHQVTNPPTTT